MCVGPPREREKESAPVFPKIVTRLKTAPSLHPDSDPTKASAAGEKNSAKGAGSSDAAPSSAVDAPYWYFFDRRMRTSLSLRLALSWEFSN